MSFLEIPTNSDNPTWSEIIKLDDISYIFSFTWNNRDSSWTLDIQSTDGSDIIMGIKLVSNYELLGTYAQTGQPQGTMFLFDTSGLKQDCDRTELGSRWKLYYITHDDPLALAVREELGLL